MAVRAEDMLKSIFDRQMDIHSGYLVYFDDVCMNEFVTGYVTNVGISIGASSASVTITYAPQFKSIDTVDDSEAYTDSNDGIQNGTSLRIFAENIFSRKYHIIFDGIIKNRTLSRNPGEFSLVFTATDYTYWLNRSVIPISIPLNEKIYSGERIRWKAQGVNVDNVSTVNFVSAGSLKGKTVSEYWNDVLKESLLENSTLYSDPNTVAVFDDAINRVSLMGDINEELVRQQVIDLVITANATFADTAYVALNNTTSTLLMEFFQDIDGMIRVKPPFWNEPVLKNHIIDPIMIKSGGEYTNWENFYTRIISIGGVEEWLSGNAATTQTQSMFTPVGVYVGNYKDPSQGKWADYLSYSDASTVYFSASQNGGVADYGDGSYYQGSSTAGIINSANEKTTWDYLKNTMKLTDAEASGIMANINQESGFNPGAVNPNSGAKGICQWLDASRVKQFNEKVAEFKNQYRGESDLMSQLRFMEWEMKQYDLINILHNSIPDTEDGAYQAGVYVCNNYEKPGEQYAATRGALARNYFVTYAGHEAKTGNSNLAGSTTVPVNSYLKGIYPNLTQCDLSANFKLSDFHCHCKSPLCTYTLVSPDLVEILQKIRNYVNKPITINSGYRCVTHNGSVKGAAAKSRHLYGCAVDFTFGNRTTDLDNLYSHLKSHRSDFASSNGRIINELEYNDTLNYIHISLTDDPNYWRCWKQ